METRGRSTRVRQELKRLLDAGVSGRVFPGAVGAVAWLEGDQVRSCHATAGILGQGLGPVREDTLYDLAGLTRSFTAIAALRLVAAERLSLSATVEELVGDLRGGVLRSITVEELLAHRSGLAEWGGFYLDVPHDLGSPAARRWLLGEVSRRPAENAGLMVESDLGYIVLGELLSRARGEAFDRVIAHEVTEPLGLGEQIMFAGSLSSGSRARLVRAAAPTERCEWRGRIVRGEAMDENAAVLGGVAGHAGLFASAPAMASFGASLLQALGGRSSFLSTAALERGVGVGGPPLGWRLKSSSDEVAASVGRRLSPRSFGEVGVTGTSLWCDPEKQLAVALLSNRSHPSRANEKISGFRPAFHDGVLAAWSYGG